MSFVHTAGVSIKINARAAATGGYGGAVTAQAQLSAALAAANMSGFLSGTLTAEAGDILLADPGDPFQDMGDSSYAPGFVPEGKSLKFLYIENMDAEETVTVSRAASNGLPIFKTAGHGLDLPPGAALCLFLPDGTVALETGVNDALTLAVSGGTPDVKLLAGYGPVAP
jgi:hypothetical protein